LRTVCASTSRISLKLSSQKRRVIERKKHKEILVLVVLSCFLMLLRFSVLSVPCLLSSLAITLLCSVGFCSNVRDSVAALSLFPYTDLKHFVLQEFNPRLQANFRRVSKSSREDQRESNIRPLGALHNIAVTNTPYQEACVG